MVSASKLQVLVYDLNDKYLGQLKYLSSSRHSGDENNVYDILGTLLIDSAAVTDSKLACKLVVLANYDKEVTEPVVGADLSDIIYANYLYDVSGISAQTSCIPMWGVRTYADTNTDDRYKAFTITHGEYIDAGEIFMLRAMSKIRVHLADDVANDYTLTNVTLSNYNRRGYILPSGYNVSETTLLHYEGTEAPLSFHPYTANVNQTLPLSVETENVSYRAYVPEYKCKTDTNGCTDPYISVTVTPKAAGGTAGIYRIELKKYTDGEPVGSGLDLIRNTIYEYTITSVGPDLSLRYQAIDWTTGGGDISFESRRK